MAEIVKERTVTKKIKSIICDKCGKHISTNFNTYKCMGCNKDLCVNCTTFLNYDPFTDCSLGDYPYKVCKDCNDSLKIYSEKCKKILGAAYKEVEKLEDEWFEKCKS